MPSTPVTPDLSTNEGFATFEKQHGGRITSRVVDPEITTNDGEKRPNPSPFYEYRYTDGTVLQMNAAGQIKSMGKQEPAAPTTSSKTPEDIAKTVADTTQTNRETENLPTSDEAAAARKLAREKAAKDLANSETPDEASARRIAEHNANASRDMQLAVEQAHAPYAAGDKLNETDSKNLDAQLRAIQDRLTSDLKAENDRATFERERPYKDAAQKQGEEANALAAQREKDTQQNAQDTLEQNAAKDQATGLRAQSQSGNSLLDEAMKAGVRVPTGSVQSLVYDPLNQAFQIMGRYVKSGQLPQSAVPTPTAPAPAAATGPQAPAPVTDPRLTPNAGPQAPMPLPPGVAGTVPPDDQRYLGAPPPA